jgi:hypothetical protein
MQRHLITFFTSPFLILGFLWQFIAGGFFAGRMLATDWVRKVAVKTLQDRGILATDPLKQRQKPDLH